MNTIGTILFALGLLLSWTNSALHVALADRPVYAGSVRMFRGPVARARLLAVSAASLGFVALVGLFVARIQPEWVAAAILLVLATIRRFEIARWHDDIVVRLGKYVPAAASLLAWLVADLVLRLMGKQIAEARALAWNASCGMMAGAYLLAGIAKLKESGFSWTDPRYQALLVAERAFAGPKWLRSMRLSIARSKRASRLAGYVGLYTEFLAVLFVVPAARPLILSAVVALNLGFMVLLGYFEVEWIAVMIAVAALAG